MDVREKLVELLAGCPCESDCDGKIGSCPSRKNGNCNEIFKLPYCSVSKLASHLIANGVTVQEWHSASNPPKEDGTYLVQTSTGTITTARFYAFKSFPATKYLPASHRSPSWQSNRNVVKWTFCPNSRKENDYG